MVIGQPRAPNPAVPTQRLDRPTTRLGSWMCLACLREGVFQPRTSVMYASADVSLPPACVLTHNPEEILLRVDHAVFINGHANPVAVPAILRGDRCLLSISRVGFGRRIGLDV